MTRLNSILTLEEKKKLSLMLVRFRRQTPAFVFLIAVVLAVYYASINIKPGWLTYSISFVALAIMAFTAIARLDDISPDKTSKRWLIRRAGLILSVAGAGAIALSPLANLVKPDAMPFPTWNQILLHWGVAMTWLTTPNMPPWLKYMTGKVSSTDGSATSDQDHS